MTARRVLTVVGGLALTATLVLVFVVNFSAVESRFECAGGFTSEKGKRTATAYLKLQEYRWWVGLWSDSDAALWVEIPNETIEYSGRIVRVGDQLNLTTTS